MTRRYYSLRTGKNDGALNFDLEILRVLFKELYSRFIEKDYFQEAFGFECVDAGQIAGTLGHSIEAVMLLRLRKPNLWPILTQCSGYSEDDIFDVIEFLYDHISLPVDGWHHDFNNCGWHYKEFDKGTGQKEFRAEVNAILQDYQEGYELSEEGEILARTDPGLENLIQAELPHLDPDNVEIRVNAAIRKYRRHRSSMEDRRDAIRDLADVLEFLRPMAKAVLTKKDEGDLFTLANDFGIRHHRQNQKTDYDKPIWYSWMFYYYLATIHAVTRLIKRNQLSKES